MLKCAAVRCLVLAFLLLSPALVIRPLLAQSYRDFTTPQPLPPHSYLIIGILGGVESWNSENRPARKLALSLRAKNIPNVYVETVENRHRKLALRLIRNALDTNQDGKLSARECASARIILYGHSLGAAAVVKLARELKSLGVPVLLTIEVDDISLEDSTIPSNVSRAANFYQHTSKLLRGRAGIRAEDPHRTQILENLEFSYAHKNVDLSGATVLERAAADGHTKMEFDPAVWAAVEELILHEVK